MGLIMVELVPNPLMRSRMSVNRLGSYMDDNLKCLDHGITPDMPFISQNKIYKLENEYLAEFLLINKDTEKILKRNINISELNGKSLGKCRGNKDGTIRCVHYFGAADISVIEFVIKGEKLILNDMREQNLYKNMRPTKISLGENLIAVAFERSLNKEEMHNSNDVEDTHGIWISVLDQSLAHNEYILNKYTHPELEWTVSTALIALMDERRFVLGFKHMTASIRLMDIQGLHLSVTSSSSSATVDSSIGTAIIALDHGRPSAVEYRLSDLVDFAITPGMPDDGKDREQARLENVAAKVYGISCRKDGAMPSSVWSLSCCLQLLQWLRGSS